jgi:hypothetical protein
MLQMQIPPPGAAVTTANMSMVCDAIVHASRMSSSEGTVHGPLAPEAWSAGNMLCVAQTPLEQMNGHPWVGAMQGKSTHTNLECLAACPATQYRALQEYAVPGKMTAANKELYLLQWACLDEVLYNTQFEHCIREKQFSSGVVSRKPRFTALHLTFAAAALSMVA